MTQSITPKLNERCEGICELCTAQKATIAFAVSPYNNDEVEHEVAICNRCNQTMEDKTAHNYWQCLAGSIWNPAPAVQALSYRMLYSIQEQEWASEIVASAAVEEWVVNWALSIFNKAAVHVDSNGTALSNGDTVVLTQLLNVKGVNFMAPKGTVVKKIRLVPNEPGQIEGKINEQTIVILTQYVRKN
jgi:protein PhnA